MHYNIPIIKQHPSRFTAAFYVPGPDAVCFANCIDDALADCFELPVHGTGTYDEEIRYGGEPTQIEKDDIVAFLVLGCVHSKPGNCQRIDGGMRIQTGIQRT